MTSSVSLDTVSCQPISQNLIVVCFRLTKAIRPNHLDTTRIHPCRNNKPSPHPSILPAPLSLQSLKAILGGPQRYVFRKKKRALIVSKKKKKKLYITIPYTHRVRLVYQYQRAVFRIHVLVLSFRVVESQVEDDTNVPAQVIKQKAKSKGPLFTVLFYGEGN